MITYRVLFVFAFISLVFAIPRPRSFSIFHERDAPPAYFKSNGPADPEQSLNIRLGLKSRNMTGLERRLYDVSTPGSQAYGEYLSKQEVESHVAPSSDTLAVVDQWLKENKLTATNISAAGEWINIQITVKQANELFQTNYQVFSHEISGMTVIRSLSVSLPDSIVNHVDAILPATDFPPKHQLREGLVSTQDIGHVKRASPPPVKRSDSQIKDLSACNVTGITPTCLQALYGIPPTVSPQNESRIAVTGLIDQYAQRDDLKIFLEKFRPDLDPHLQFGLQTTDDGINPQNSSLAGTEANLDIQYTVGVAGGVPITFISVGDDTHDDMGGFLDIINFLLNEPDPPQVLTTSYGNNEDNIPPSISMKFCNTVLQLSARGTSVLFSSGDGGVAGAGQGEDCTTFLPSLSASCPYITSVGSTEGISPETAAFFSSGGFSNVFQRPHYQDAAVKSYLDRIGDAYAGSYNPNGRGYPDVSVQGRNFVIVNATETKIVSGTSCSVPTFASMIAQLNALRLQEGKKVLGFLNPMIYANPELFNDITFGSNPGCRTNGFPASSGWDPVTGVGTPNFEKLRNLP